MRRAEGLRAPGGQGIKRGQTLEILKCVADLERLSAAGGLAAQTVAAEGPDQTENLGLDDKDDLRKARADGIVDGVFHQHLTVRADAVDLLISSIARAETRRHDDKGCVHCFSSFSAVGGGYAPRVYHILPRASRRIPGIPAKYRSYTAHFAACAAAFRAQMHIFSTFYKKVTVL